MRLHDASMTIYGLDKATKKQREFVAKWLERQARFIRPMHREFGPRFTAKILSKGEVAIAERSGTANLP